MIEFCAKLGHMSFGRYCVTDSRPGANRFFSGVSAGDKVAFLFSKLTRTKRLSEELASQLCDLGEALTVRDCVKLMSVISPHLLCNGTFQRLGRVVSSRIPALLEGHPNQLELAILSLSRIPHTGDQVLNNVCATVADFPDLPRYLGHLSAKELVNILNILSKRFKSSQLTHAAASLAIERQSECDHRSGSLLVASISRMPPSLHPRLLEKVSTWCESQVNLVREWSPQSVSLFVYSLSKLTSDRRFSNFVEALISSSDLLNFSDQNLCNLAVGVDKISDALLQEISSRDLARKDLFFLLKSHDKHVFDLVIGKLQAGGSLKLEDLVIVCNLAPAHMQSIAGVVKANLASYSDTEQLLFVLNKLNMPVHESVIAVPKSAKKAADVLWSCFKLELAVGDQIQALVEAVLADPQVSSADVSKSILALVSMNTPLDHELLKRLTHALPTSGGNDIDKRQLASGGVNDIDKRQLARAVGIATVLDLSVDEAILKKWLELSRGAAMETKPNSSRGHKAIIKAMIGIATESEHYVAPVSSYVDILVVPS